MIGRRFLILSGLSLVACGPLVEAERVAVVEEPPLYPNETPELRALINQWADHYELPRHLVHRLAIRESTHRPWARNGPYWGLFQILPATARSMGFRGPNEDLLKPEVNLEFALRYLKGAYIVADGDEDAAIMWYAKGYYYEAKRLGLLVETGLRPG
ncbi:lytic transglycosylase domain-containing protein [Tropicibacter naphthalenivorans]|uniref:Transglycosylase SLT domain protein n=1 Tax=Tropicibacter naphthalenivorans TaxID=441103 RepID=A0A0P1G954_9RHOB|nr:lytic transglycosylase domain-containing protein [Tropicibacter naphthalenivorans]CUH78045.1 Transglycosylase SLT domain protein [Tropicibacter naphthalenivorans]SMC94028.1 Transglycosylase SLT domain-containing protein [Tropicibacter naphthalenivorans]